YEQLMRMVERLNKSMGSGTMRLAVERSQHSWQTTSERRSPYLWIW
ncbi:MAG: DUF4113 domain-containing protein, partial [Hydrococcus sp. RM1_1_31]|nr:DUF4113 domain-containing protein [Hydrococcus sp. RM1_1_31]